MASLNPKNWPIVSSFTDKKASPLKGKAKSKPLTDVNRKGMGYRPAPPTKVVPRTPGIKLATGSLIPAYPTSVPAAGFNSYQPKQAVNKFAGDEVRNSVPYTIRSTPAAAKLEDAKPKPAPVVSSGTKGPVKKIAATAIKKAVAPAAPAPPPVDPFEKIQSYYDAFLEKMYGGLSTQLQDSQKSMSERLAAARAGISGNYDSVESKLNAVQSGNQSNLQALASQLGVNGAVPEVTANSQGRLSELLANNQGRKSSALTGWDFWSTPAQNVAQWQADSARTGGVTARTDLLNALIAAKAQVDAAKAAAAKGSGGGGGGGSSKKKSSGKSSGGSSGKGTTTVSEGSELLFPDVNQYIAGLSGKAKEDALAAWRLAEYSPKKATSNAVAQAAAAKKAPAKSQSPVQAFGMGKVLGPISKQANINRANDLANAFGAFTGGEGIPATPKVTTKMTGKVKTK